VALAEDDNGTPAVGLNVELADVQVAEADMCTVVVALAYTSVLVIVLVNVSVVVTLLASTAAGASRATSAAVAVVKRICKDCGKIQLECCLSNALDYMVKWVESVGIVRALMRSIAWVLCLSSRVSVVRDRAVLFQKGFIRGRRIGLRRRSLEGSNVATAISVRGA